MRVQPFTTHPGISRDELIQYECSDRIVLPIAYATEMFINVNDLLMLTNVCDQHVCGTVFGTHTHNPAVVYIPSWMTHLLDVLDPITIAYTPIRRCTALQIKPHAESFRKHPKFMELLTTALFDHKSVSKGARIPLLVEKEITYLTIEHIAPDDITTCFLYNTGHVDIKIHDSLDHEPPQKPHSFLYRPGRGPDPRTQHPMAFVGRGRQVGGCFTTPYVKTPQAAAAAAAKKRAALHAQGKRTY